MESGYEAGVSWDRTEARPRGKLAGAMAGGILRGAERRPGTAEASFRDGT